MHEEALVTYRHIINKLDPRCTEARLSLGNLLRRLGDEKAALEVLEPSLLVGSQEPEADSQEGREDKQASSDEEDDYEESSSEGDSSDNGSDEDEDDLSRSEEENGSENSDAEAQASEVIDGTSRSVNSSRMLCNNPSAIRLAYERCKLLDSPNTIEKFLQESCRLLFGDVMQVYSCERPGRKLIKTAT